MNITLTEYKLKCPQCGELAFEVLRFRPGTSRSRITLRCVNCKHVFGFTQNYGEDDEQVRSDSGV
jgi:uncharacterized Zn finger protein